MEKKQCFMRTVLAGALTLVFYGFTTVSANSPGEIPDISSSSLQQAGKVVTCVVSDEVGPIPGANVFIAGTTTGTITDNEGRAILHNVPEGAVLVISYIGYITQEIPIGNRTTVEVTLLEDT